MNATPEDLAAIDRLIKPQEPPERIYGWKNGQLSLASHYGGLVYQGHSYLIAYGEEGMPLVRADVIEREVKEQNARHNAARRQAKGKQGELL